MKSPRAIRFRRTVTCWCERITTRGRTTRASRPAREFQSGEVRRSHRPLHSGRHPDRLRDVWWTDDRLQHGPLSRCDRIDFAPDQLDTGRGELFSATQHRARARAHRQPDGVPRRAADVHGPNHRRERAAATHHFCFRQRRSRGRDDRRDERRVSWTANSAGTNTFSIRATTDNGAPALSDTKTFEVVVTTSFHITSIGLSNDVVTLRWNAMTGSSYGIEYKNSLADAGWLPLTTNITTVSNSARASDRSARTCSASTESCFSHNDSPERLEPFVTV